MLCHFWHYFPIMELYCQRVFFSNSYFIGFFPYIFFNFLSDGLILPRSEGKFINLILKKNLIFFHNSLYIKPFL